MRLQPISLLAMVLMLIYIPSWCGEPTYKQGVNTFIETGVTEPDRVPTWYAPMAAKPYAPSSRCLRPKGHRGATINVPTR